MKYLFIIFLFMMSSTSQATTIYQPVAQPLDSSKVETRALKRENRMISFLTATSIISGIAAPISYFTSVGQAVNCAGMYLCFDGLAAAGFASIFFILLLVSLIFLLFFLGTRNHRKGKGS